MVAPILILVAAWPTQTHTHPLKAKTMSNSCCCYDQQSAEPTIGVFMSYFPDVYYGGPPVIPTLMQVQNIFASMLENIYASLKNIYASTIENINFMQV